MCLVGSSALFADTSDRAATKGFDKRELYLMIEDENWGTVLRCGPDEGHEVRRVAQAINLAARQAAE